MLTIKTDQFDAFRCIAGDCPRSCCTGGWYIDIDEESLERFRRGTGVPKLDHRMRVGIDWQEGCFLVTRSGDCAMLDPDGLCSMQRVTGEAYLCDTCREYPRHVEEFENIREWSLSLSCPEAARMIVERTEPLHFLRSETPEQDDPEDYEDVDPGRYETLSEAREEIFHIIQDRRKTFREKSRILIDYAREVERIFRERYPEDYPESAEKDPLDPSLFEVMFELQESEEDWLAAVERTRERWQTEGELSAAEEIQAEQLLMFWFYTYFCGAAYDGLVVAKAMLAVCAVWWTFQVQAANPASGMDEVAYRLARVIEHADENLDALESCFIE